MTNVELGIDDYAFELKRAPGICCPEPTCDYVRKEYVTCEGCGTSCIGCLHKPIDGGNKSE